MLNYLATPYMRWLTRLITPPGGLVLDPFAGSGTTGAAALEEGMRCLLIEREAEYIGDIINRFSQLSDITEPDLFIEKPTPPKQEAML